MLRHDAFMVLFCLLALVSSWSVVNAAPPVPADTPCDPKYYESLKARAWLEAEREITQNQNLIFKPDSVLQYTCFDRFQNELVQEAPNMLSGTGRWGGGLGTDMKGALQNLVGNALEAYIKANYTYPDSGPLKAGARLLGGRSNGTYAPGKIAAGAYSCDVMKNIWKEAKCMNFISSSTHDGFFTFEQYAGTNDPRDEDDKRFLPTACDTIAPRWADNIETAYVDVPGGRAAAKSTPWAEDNIVTYLALLDPANCGDDKIVKPIETGVIVERPKGADPTTYIEKACLPASCHYVPSAAAKGDCVSP